MLPNKPAPIKSKKTNKKEKEKGTGTGKNLVKNVSNNNYNNRDTNSKSKNPRAAKFGTLNDLVSSNNKLLECIESSRLNQVLDQIKNDRIDPHYFPEGNLFEDNKKKKNKKKKKTTETPAIPSKSTISPEVLNKSHSSNEKKNPREPSPTIIKIKNEPDFKKKRNMLTIEAAKKVIEETFRLPNVNEFSEPFKKLVGNSLEINIDSEEDFKTLRTPRTVMEERTLKHHERKTKRILEETRLKKKANSGYENTDNKVLNENLLDVEVKSHFNKTRLKSFEDSILKELNVKVHDEASGDCFTEQNKNIKTKTSYNSQLEIESINWSNICNFDKPLSSKTVFENNEEKHNVIDNRIELSKKLGIGDEYFDCCEQNSFSKFDPTYDQLVMSTIKPFDADCWPHIENNESSMELTPNLSELYNFKKLLNQCNNIKKQPNNQNNILSNNDIKLLNDIIEADEQYKQFHKEDHALLKEVLIGHLNQIEHQSKIVGNVLKSIRSTKSLNGNMNVSSQSQDNSFRTPVESKTVLDSSATESYLYENCAKDIDVKTMITDVPLSSEKESSLNASVNDNFEEIFCNNEDEEAARLATEIRVIFKNLPIAETSDSDSLAFHLSSCISKIPNLDKITQILESESSPSMFSGYSPIVKPIEIPELKDLTKEESCDNISTKSSNSNCSTAQASVRVSVRPKKGAVKKCQTINASPTNSQESSSENHKTAYGLKNNCDGKNNNCNDATNKYFQNNSSYKKLKARNPKIRIEVSDDSVIHETDFKTESIHDIQKKRPKSDRSYFETNSHDPSNANVNDFSNIKSYLSSCKDLSPHQTYLKKFPSIHDLLDRIDSPRSVFTLISEDDMNISSLSNFQCNKIILSCTDNNIIGLDQNNIDLGQIDIITINQMKPVCQQYVFHMYDVEYYYRIEAYKSNKINSICLVNICNQAQEYRIQLLSLSDLKIIKEFYVPEQQEDNEFQLKKTNFFELISKPDELYTVVKNPEIISQLKITKENFNFESISNNKIKISKSLNKLFNNKNMDEILFEVYETNSENVCKFSNNLFNISKLEAGDYELNSSNNNCHDILSITSDSTLSTSTTTTLLLSDSGTTNTDSKTQNLKLLYKQQDDISNNKVAAEKLSNKQINEQEIQTGAKVSLNQNQKNIENESSASILINESIRKKRKKKLKHKQKQILRLIIGNGKSNKVQMDNNTTDMNDIIESSIFDNNSSDKDELFNNNYDEDDATHERCKKCLAIILYISIFGLLIWALANPYPLCLDVLKKEEKISWQQKFFPLFF